MVSCFKALMAATAATFVMSGAAQAGLVNRGGGMIYDTTLNITWLYDWNYAKTSNYDADGFMTWTSANDWANNLVFGGFSDWRLPTVAQPDATCSGHATMLSFGEHDFGFNCTGGEMGHLFYTDLGGEAWQSVLDPTGDTAQEIANRQLFVNVNVYDHWSGTELAPNSGYAWVFSFYTGNQFVASERGELFRALAVRPGDVVAAPLVSPLVPGPGQVPEPSSLLLVGVALGGVAINRRRSLKPSRSPG